MGIACISGCGGTGIPGARSRQPPQSPRRALGRPNRSDKKPQRVTLAAYGRSPLVTQRGFRHRPKGFALGRILCRAMGPAARGSFVVGCPPNIAAKGPKRAAENRGCLQRGARQPKTASRRLSRGNQCARIGPLRCPQKANTLFSLRSSCDLDVLGLSVLRAPRTARNAPEITPRRTDGPQEGPKKGPCQPKRGPEQPKRARRRPKRPP